MQTRHQAAQRYSYQRPAWWEDLELSVANHAAQGHFQIVFSGSHCPLFQRDLPWFQRLMYCSGVWSYIVGAITAPVFNAIPLVTIWAGVFPIVVSWWAASELPLLLYCFLFLSQSFHSCLLLEQCRMYKDTLLPEQEAACNCSGVKRDLWVRCC